jgi:hypothetical protein
MARNQELGAEKLNALQSEVKVLMARVMGSGH